MIVIVPGAFLAAGLAHPRTELANLRGHFRATAHIGGRGPTDLCTIHVKADAAGHLGNVVFVQTRGGAVFAGLSAFGAGPHAGFKFIVAHGMGILWFEVFDWLSGLSCRVAWARSIRASD